MLFCIMLFAISDSFAVVINLRTVVNDLRKQAGDNKGNKNAINRHTDGQGYDREHKSSAKDVMGIPGGL